MTGDRSYLEGALEGIEFERSVFSVEHGNWPDLSAGRGPDPSGFPVKWCHGASGIALGRLGCRRIADSPGLGDEIEAGLAATRRSYLQSPIYTAAGIWAGPETFLVAAGLTGESEWQHLAATGAASVVERAARNGGYRVFATGRTTPASSMGRPESATSSYVSRTRSSRRCFFWE